MNGNEWDVEDLDDDNWGDDDWDLDGEKANKVYEQFNDLSDEINNGQRVRDLRMLMEMTPDALADYAMISVKELLAIEAGMLHLERPLAQLLADGIGVEISDIWVEQDKAA